MTDPGRASKRMTTFIVCVSLALGVAARINSYNANDRLQGDVNLFALTACEFVESGRLFYPFKYDFSSHVTYQQLSDPATQHPPLWPLFAGLSARVFHSHDSFSVLKFLSFLFGVMLLFVLFLLAFKQRGYHLDVCITLVLASFHTFARRLFCQWQPICIDGSPALQHFSNSLSISEVT
jgi:hypothetical protein